MATKRKSAKKTTKKPRAPAVTGKTARGAAKPRKTAPTAPKAKETGLSGLDAAARVLKEAGEPLGCKAMVEMMLAKGYWKTEGQTPSATLYSAIIREVALKKSESRFKKVGRGLFELNA